MTQPFLNSLKVLKGHPIYLNFNRIAIVSMIKLTGDFKASDSEKDLGLTSHFNKLYKPTG